MVLALGLSILLSGQSKALEMNSNTTTTITSVTVTTTDPDTEISTTTAPTVTTVPANVTAPDPDDPITNSNAQMSDITAQEDQCVGSLSVTKSNGEQVVNSKVDVCGLAGVIFEEVPETESVFTALPGEEDGITEAPPPE
jgi:hypothetical protein